MKNPAVARRSRSTEGRLQAAGLRAFESFIAAFISRVTSWNGSGASFDVIAACGNKTEEAWGGQPTPGRDANFSHGRMYVGMGAGSALEVPRGGPATVKLVSDVSWRLPIGRHVRRCPADVIVSLLGTGG